MDAAFEQLRALAAEIADLEKTSYLLGWDQETHMPSCGTGERLHQYATLQRLVRERWTSDRLAQLLEDLAPLEAELDPRSDEGSLIRVMRRDSDKARRVPLDVQLTLTDANARGFQQWLVAREQQDFEILRPQFERVLETRRAYAAAFEPQEDPYDALLDDYEPGMTSRAVDPIFAQVKAALLTLLDALKDAPPTDDSCLSGRFPEDAQRRFALWLIGQWGFENNSWRLDNSVHPSQFSLASADVRITTWFDPTNLAGVFACLHEFGHGLYRRQVAPSLSRTPLREPASSALDESQSRLWENLVGRRLATWRFAYPRLQEELTSQFGDVPLIRFYRAINMVQPSLIRTSADEVTYSLHIILRYELERELLAGSVAAADLPAAFDAKMRDYLGRQPSDISQGVLQDPHWFDLGFGYFPTITLGDIVSVQLWERAEANLGDLDSQLEKGDFDTLRAWLADNLHAHGRKFTAPDTIKKATGKPLDAGPYIAYLQRKYTKLLDTDG